MKLSNTFLFVLICLAISNFSQAQISGTVFRDYNNNGSRETSSPNEPLANGITINVYNTSDVLIATATSAGTASPNYSFPAIGPNSVASGTKVRLEFIIPTTFLNGVPGANGASSNTSVRFLTAGATAININFGVFNSNEYYQDNPKVIVPKFVRGTAAPLSTTDVVLNSFPYVYGQAKTGSTTAPAGQWTTTNPPPIGYRPDPSPEATQNQVGTIYGLAWASNTKKLFLGSYLKRKAPLGPGGLGVIYVINNPVGNPTTNNPTVYVDLNAIFSNSPAGTLGFTRETNNAYDWNDDVGVKPLIGKRGLGDMDVNNKQDTIYTIGLNDRKLYAVPTSGTLSSATIKSYDFISSITTLTGVAAGQFANSEIHPFGIGINPRDNFIYIGGVYGDDGNGSVTSNIRMLVWTFNPINGTITLVLNRPLGYGRSTNGGNAYGSAPINIPATPPAGGNAQFRAWNDNFTEGAGTASSLQQAMLTDIAFDGDAMILGFRDRFGDQTPETGLTLPSDDPYTRGNGEIVRAYSNSGTWTLEAGGVSKDGNTGATITGSTVTGTGPGNGEFYYQDWSSDADSWESSMGSLIMIPGKEHVMSTAFDPSKVNQNNQLVFGNPNSNGVQTHSNINGTNVGAYEVYTSGQGSAANAFAKTNGLGDLATIFDAPPIEIGNRVWNDANNDGIQNAGEAGLSGVVMELLNSGGTVIASATTAADGSYYFSSATGTSTASAIYGVNILPNTNYTLRVAGTVTSINTINGNAGLSNTTNFFTIKGASGNGQLGLSNNSAAPVGGTGGRYQVSITTGLPGQNNHNIDFGFAPTNVLPVTITSFTAQPQGNAVALQWNVAEQININTYEVQYSKDGSNFATFTTVAATNSLSAVYNAVHNSPSAGVNYYRIKIVEKTGLITYSDIRKVTIGNGNTVNVYPNPANRSVNIVLTGSMVNKPATISILSIDGKLVSIKKINTANQTETIDVSKMTNGKYIVRIITDADVVTKTIEIIR